MSLKEQVYSVLILSASKSFNDSVSTLLSEKYFNPIRFVDNVSSAKRIISEHSYDFVVINSPLPDDAGIRFSIDLSNNSIVTLLMVRAELHEEINDKVREHGVFTLPKPTSRQIISTAISWMISARERLRKSEKKTSNIEEKMQEIRLVNKAKWYLISNRGMCEEDAHRYIEKMAMDRCVSKKIIANEILNG